MRTWLLVGIALILIGLFIRDKTILLKEDGKRCFKIVKTVQYKRGD